MTNDHYQYMEQALVLAAAALEAGEFPVGCVIVHENQVVADGRRQNSRSEACELEHAEIVALRNLLRDRPGVALDQVTVYSTMEPCLMCYSTLLVNGVRRFVFAYEDAMGGGTSLELTSLAPLYRAMAVNIVPAVMRQESLSLFQAFFANRKNHYLQGTLLAEYTLRQK